MNSFYNREELEEIGFSSIGSNVLISRIYSDFMNNVINSYWFRPNCTEIIWNATNIEHACYL